VYRRAELSRTVMLVVALLLMAVSTGVCACEFRTVNAGSDDHPPLLALPDMGSLDNSGARSMSVWPDMDLKPFRTSMTRRYAGMERIRKVERI
jgi:hypothetical protein